MANKLCRPLYFLLHRLEFLSLLCMVYFILYFKTYCLLRLNRTVYGLQYMITDLQRQHTLWHMIIDVRYAIHPKLPGKWVFQLGKRCIPVALQKVFDSLAFLSVRFLLISNENGNKCHFIYLFSVLNAAD